MPKGGLLHVHGVTAMDFRVLAERCVATRRCACQLHAGRISALDFAEERLDPAAATLDSAGWLPLDSLADPVEQLHAALTLGAGDRLVAMNECWGEFMGSWALLDTIGQDRQLVWKELFPRLLQQVHDGGVCYLEMKLGTVGIGVGSAPRGAAHREWRSEERLQRMLDTVDAFAEAVAAFRAREPGFLGAKVVLVGLKRWTDAEVEATLSTVLEVLRRRPGLIAGFDLAGPEQGSGDPDEPSPLLARFAPALAHAVAAAEAEGLALPLLLHAGESYAPGNTELVDAFALGCARVGHGLTLPRHPALMAEAVAAGTPAFEVCPLSNQLLGYTPNLHTHPGLLLIRNGVNVCLANDDPGIFQYGGDLSYDFAAAAAAWRLRFAEIKQLVLNSLRCSALAPAEKAAALAALEVAWTRWVDAELARMSPKL
jgi:adenosine deaminase-related growth factor